MGKKPRTAASAPVVGIDSNTLIHAGLVPRKAAKSSLTVKDLELLAELQRRAKLLFEQLRTEGARIVISSVSLAELLIPVPKAAHGSLVSELSKWFQVQSFDRHAAAIAAELWVLHSKLPSDLQYEKDKRYVLKSDVMIVATAKTVGCTRFYTHDKRCRSLAKLVMEGRDLPTRDDRLFSEKELRETMPSDDVPTSGDEAEF